MKERIEKLMSWLTGTNSSLKFALLVFGWTLACGLLIQLVLLPHVFPQMQASPGLLKGLDSPKYHRIMLELSERIRQEGWGAWQLYPRGQAVAGIGAIFYVLIAPEPWALLPWNALLHGLAAFFMVELGRLIFKDNKLALVSALPLAFFPSAFTWTAQMHNENYTVLGGLMALYACALILNTNEKMKSWKRMSAFLIMPIGLGLIFMVRDWMFQALTVVTILSLLIVQVCGVLNKIIKKKAKRKINTNITFTFMFILLLSVLLVSLSDITFNITEEIIPDEDFIEIEAPIETPEASKPRKVNIEWQRMDSIPRFVDEKMYEIAFLRAKQLYKFPGGHTNFDENVAFNSTMDILFYTPQAAVVGLLSPFPNMWFSQSEKVTSGLTRATAGVEMMLAYAMLPGLLLAGFQFKRKNELWVIVLICLGMMTVMAVGMPNLGTIYRFRYPFLCTLVGLGGGGWLNFARKKLGGKV